MSTTLDVLEDTSLFPIVDALVACLCAELAHTPDGSPCFCGMLPGAAAAMDFCDCGGDGACGQGWVRVSSIYPSRSFPAPSGNLLGNCLDPLAATLEVGVTRCWAGMDGQGNPPDEVAQTQSVRTQLADMQAMRRAIQCCLDTKQSAIGQYRPVGPAGNCGGGIWTVAVRL